LVKEAGGGDPETIIRMKARAKVEWAKGLGWSGPPYQPILLASLLGIKHQPNSELLSAEAQLTPLPKRQLLLEFNPERAEVRRNFSICHEIAHTFFPDCYKIAHQRKSDPGKYGPESEVEQLCQIGAAELLMPVSDFMDDLRRVRFSMRSVKELSTRYTASREAVLRRMVQLGDRPAALVFFSLRLSPNEQKATKRPRLLKDLDNPAPKMRILYAVSSPNFPVYLPPHKSVPNKSCVYSAVEADKVVAQRECWELNGFGEWQVEAMALPVPIDAADDTATVAALVMP